jgi:hypothetical protein
METLGLWFTAPTIQETAVPVNRRDPMAPSAAQKRADFI